MSFLVNPHHNNSHSFKRTPPTFTLSLIIAMLVVGGFAFASVALVPFKSFPFMLQIVIATAGPLELAFIWAKARSDTNYTETARYHTYGYFLGFAAGMSCLGIF